MRFLLVEEPGDFRSSLAAMLRTRWPDAEVEEWDPREKGMPRDEDCSAVLLDTHPAGEDGFGWLAELRKGADAPPVVLI